MKHCTNTFLQQATAAQHLAALDYRTIEFQLLCWYIDQARYGRFYWSPRRYGYWCRMLVSLGVKTSWIQKLYAKLHRQISLWEVLYG